MANIKPKELKKFEMQSLPQNVEPAQSREHPKTHVPSVAQIWLHVAETLGQCEQQAHEDVPNWSKFQCHQYC